MSFEPGLTIITATGERPKSLALCANFVNRQTWRGPLQWIVVDDGASGTARNILLQRGVLTRIYPTPVWKLGENTLARNLLAALPEVCYDKILFFEDDDYYPASYAQTAVDWLEVSSLVGEQDSRYYHIPQQRYRVMRCFSHASLAQTGMHAQLIPLLTKLCTTSPQFIDVRLWDRVKTNRRYLSALVVGIKGLPGRAGIGVGHRLTGPWVLDQNLTVLQTWLGKDIELYREFLL